MADTMTDTMASQLESVFVARLQAAADWLQAGIGYTLSSLNLCRDTSCGGFRDESGSKHIGVLGNLRNEIASHVLPILDRLH